MFPRPHPKPRPALLTRDETEQAVQQASLSRELSEFLIEMSIGVHRYAMYPAGHPSHDPVLDNIIRRLSELFVDRPSISIGVAARQLIIEGMATDQKHPVLSDLAKRLHGHQLGAISFERGISSPLRSATREPVRIPDLKGFFAWNRPSGQDTGATSTREADRPEGAR